MGQCPIRRRAGGLGIAFFYMPTHVRSTIGRRTATLVRGTDAFGHWDAEPMPRTDLDPECMAFLRAELGSLSRSRRATGGKVEGVLTQARGVARKPSGWRKTGRSRPMIDAQVVLNGLVLGGLYACVAVGFSLVWGVLNVINLLHGSLIVLGAYLAYWAFAGLGLHPFLALPAWRPFCSRSVTSCSATSSIP